MMCHTIGGGGREGFMVSRTKILGPLALHAHAFWGGPLADLPAASPFAGVRHHTHPSNFSGCLLFAQTGLSWTDP